MKRFRLLLAMFVALCLIAPAIGSAQKSKITPDKLPTLLGSTNAGNEFYFSFPPCYEESAGGDNSLRVFIASGVRQEVRLEIESEGFVMVKVVPANDVVEFKIPPAVGQPFSKTPQAKAPPERVLPGKAIHIKSKAPIIAYGVTRFLYTSDGFLAVPVSGLGEEYIVGAWPQYTAVNAGYNLPAETTITAAYDDTDVTFEMAGTSSSKTTGGLKAGQSKTWRMKRGDVICITNMNDLEDISGSYIKASKPVAVVSGNQCANVPAGIPWCDYTAEMDLPIKTWGTEYHVTPIAKRKNNPVVRIFVRDKNTTLYRDGAQWRVVNRNTRLFNSGFIESRSFDGAPRPVVISGNKPIYVMLYNPGQADDDVPSDPFQIVLTPLEQYQTEIVFCTPGAKGGTLPFTEHYVNLVYQLTDFGTLPDDLEFGTVVNGKVNWQAIKSVFGSNPGQVFSVPIRGKNYANKLLTLPGDGVYRIRAKDPFAAYAYGFSSYDSYGFPTSVALGDLTKKDTVAPVLKWEQKCDGTVEGATAEDLPKDPEVRSNLALIYMDPEPTESYNYTFNYDKNNTFVAGQTIKTDWSLTVDDVTKDAKATLYFVDRAGNETKLVVTYSAYSVTLTPTPIDYGVLKSGAALTKKVTLTNTGSQEVTITKFQLKDGGQGFTLVGITLPIVLAPKESRQIDVMFSNINEGQYKDSIGVGNDCLFKNLVAVYAEVVVPIIEVSDIDFQTIIVNKTKQNKIYVRNTGKVDLLITGWTGPTDPTVFNPLTANWPADMQAASSQTPCVIKPGESRALDIQFQPTAVNTYGDKIVFANDAKNNGTYKDNVGELKGRAVQPQLTATNFDWLRKRIKSRRTPNAPYSGTITLENQGTAPVTIIKATSPASSVFGYNVSDFANKVFQSGEKHDYTVTFDPDTTGDHALDITFETDDPNIRPISELRGIGIVPRITTKDVDFGMTLVKTAPANSRQYEITCESYQWEDSVTITDFIPQVAGSVGRVGTGAYGSKGFRFDAATMMPSGKLIIQPGNTLTFDADFLAQQVAPVSEPMTTKSDAEAETVSVWSGVGNDPFVPIRDMVATGGSVGPICVNTDGQITTATIRNLGNVDMDLNDLTTNDPQFTLVSPLRTALPITMKPGETQNVVINYRPTSVGTHTAYLTFVNSTRDTSVVLTGTAQSFSRETFVTLGTSASSSATHVGIGENLTAHIHLKDGASMALAGASSARVKLLFDKTLLSYNSIRGANGYVVRDVTTGAGFVEFTAVAQNIIDAAGEIASIDFRVMLPQTTGATAQDKITFNLESEILGNTCAVLNPTGADITIDPACGYSFRKILGSGKAYSLIAVGPNPVTSDEMEVRMSVGLQSGTELTIFDATGAVVKHIDLGSLEVGEYDIKVNVAELASGSYTVRLRSGLYSTERQIVIAK
ncbi:hypothetical protein MASR2M18_02240 [Ignavibacteria bacterium]|nr:choice-of-anchor D domain-containing protein [Bacteroidota bacterium]